MFLKTIEKGDLLRYLNALKVVLQDHEFHKIAFYSVKLKFIFIYTVKFIFL